MKSKWFLLIVYICLGFSIEVFDQWIGSTYLNNLYKTPFFAILVTMTVFSFTMFSYIAGKMSELEVKYGISFKGTRKELKDAFQILVFLDIVFVACLILRYSKLSVQPFSCFLLMSLLNILFIFVIHILIDLGKTIFKMFDTVGNFRDLDNNPNSKD